MAENNDIMPPDEELIVPVFNYAGKFYPKKLTDIEGGGGGGDVSRKADKVKNATENDLAALDKYGNLKDSGKKLADLATKQSVTSLANTVSNKVDKVPNKGLSTNDYTNTDKQKVQGAYSKPSGGIPSSDLSSAVQSSLSKADNSYSKPDTGIPESDLSQDVQDKLNSAGGGYIKPEDGIPSSDMTQEVQESLSKADNSVQQVSGKGLSTNDYTNEDKQKVDDAYSLPSGGIPSTDMTQEVQASLGKADNSVQQVSGKDLSTNDFTNEYKGKLDNLDTSLADKMDIPQSSTENHFVSFDANGNAKDSGKGASDFATSAQGNKADTAYQLPSEGIPKSDLASAVQTSLEKADSAMQSIGSSDTSTDIDGTEKLAIGLALSNKGILFSTVAKLWDFFKTSKLTESTTNIGGDAATASAAKSGSTLETQLGQKEVSSNKKQSIDPTSTTDYPSSKALADYVGDAVSLAAADYISDNGNPFTSIQDLPTSTSVVSNNDYAFVTGTDQAGNTYYDRYKATVSGSTVTWGKEFRLNNSSFTAAQWSAISSGITSVLVTSYNNHLSDTDIHVTTQNKSDWNAKYDKPQGGIPSTDLSQGVQDLLNEVDNPEEGTLIDLVGDDEFIDVTESNGTITISLIAETDDYEV